MGVLKSFELESNACFYVDINRVTPNHVNEHVKYRIWEFLPMSKISDRILEIFYSDRCNDVHILARHYQPICIESTSASVLENWKQIARSHLTYELLKCKHHTLEQINC